MTRTWAFAAAVALVVVGVVLRTPPANAVQVSPPPTPAYAGDFPDPSVVWDAATGSYWAYATQNGSTNVQVMSESLTGSWSPVSDALPNIPAWASAGHTWAPTVAHLGARWVMWYTTREASSGRQCVSVATASQPGGPFTDTSTGPVICQLVDGGSIDADIFTNGTTSYLLWKSDDNALGAPTHIWAAPLSSDGTSVGGTWTEILNEDASWQAPAMEGPTMVANGGTFYLFYGANNWDSTGAGIGYATCAGPLGPCTDQTTSGPWLSSYGSALGPSGPDVFTDASGATSFAYHAWYTCVGYPGCNRALWIGQLSFVNGVPRLATASRVTASRIFGQDAIGTSVAVSQASFPAGGSAKSVVLARSDFFSDALAGGPLAAQNGGPLLITPGPDHASTLDPRVQSEIQRVLPSGSTVYLLGGALALSPAIDAALHGLGYDTQRVEGPNEYATAVEIAGLLGNPTTVLEATGLDFQDALSAVPAAIGVHGSILLTAGPTQAPETAAYLAAHPPATRYAIGGPLAAAGADPRAVPVYGQDLYGTSAAVGSRFFPSPATFGAATSASFPDALSGGLVLGAAHAPMLLVPSSGILPAPISGYLSNVAGGITSGTVFGGPLAVGDDVLSQLNAIA